MLQLAINNRYEVMRELSTSLFQSYISVRLRGTERLVFFIIYGLTQAVTNISQKTRESFFNIIYCLQCRR